MPDSTYHNPTLIPYAGQFSFSSSSSEVQILDRSGQFIPQKIATITRSLGTWGKVKVPLGIWLPNYNSAKAGIDFQVPTLFSVTFLDGQTSADVVIPVFQNPNVSSIKGLNLYLDTPTNTGGFPPSLGNQATASVAFINAAPVFSNPNPIQIPDGKLQSSAPAGIYPSSITVSGVTNFNKVVVNLQGWYDDYPTGVAALLVHKESSRGVVLFAGVGGRGSLQDVWVSLDSTVPNPIPNGQILPGTYRPTVNILDGTFPAPAPKGKFGTDLGIFKGTNVNGTFDLYIIQQDPGVVGLITQGWSIEFI